jgi:O-antigen/teichoic acid export membrane protein
MLDFVVPFAVLGFAALGAFAPLVLRILFSEAFASAESLFLPVLLYQFTVVLFWMFGSPLLAAGRARLWLTLELVSAGTKVVLAAWLVPLLGVNGLALSLLLFALLHLSLNVLAAHRALGVTVAASRYAGVALGAAVIAACSWLPSFGPLGIAATAVALGITLAVCVRAFRVHT